MDILGFFFTVLAVIIKAVIDILHKFLYEHICSFTWSKYLVVKLLDPRVDLCLT